MVPTHNTQQQVKVQIMEACRNYLHNGLFTPRSMALIEEMRTVVRDGDSIGSEGRNRDDRTFATALGIRAWDEKIRRQMIAGNRTREAERAKLSLSPEDRWSLFQRHNLQDFFRRKEAARGQQQLAAARNAWRGAVGSRDGRRW